MWFFERERLFVRLYGLVWIGMAIFTGYHTWRNNDGMAIVFCVMSLGFCYLHFSGNFDPPDSSEQ